MIAPHEILSLWRRGFNTHEIAIVLSGANGRVREHDIANALPEILERDRQNRAWDQHQPAE